MSVTFGISASNVGGYRMEVGDEAIVCYGGIPLEDLSTRGPIMTLAKRRGLDLMDALVAGHLKASMVITTRKHSEKWRKELGLTIAEVAP